MGKHRGPEDRKKLEPEDVLAGRVKVGVPDLLDLIHRVNPTGRELRSREAEQRYALKSRLQSLLVRRFGPELEVVLDPEHEGTVSLLHRGHGRDGCHAVVDALDEDARAWVKLQLDLGPPSSETAPPQPPAPRPSSKGLARPDDERPVSDDASPESLVAHAREAALAYDYERARAHLERATAESGGEAGPAAALLALLVETLGDDAGALAQKPSLSRAALAHPDVRALLALAEARSGDGGRALALLEGANEQRAADVLAALATSAVSAGDAERASGHLEGLRKRDPAHAAIGSLTDEIARLRAAARGPSEADVTALASAGKHDEALKKAAELLARWPESDAARRVIRLVEERRRHADFVRVVAAADALLAEGDRAHAVAELRRAAGMAQGAARDEVERRARTIEAAVEEEREAQRVEEVRARLARSDPREGLIAFLELGAPLRERVEEHAVTTGASPPSPTSDLLRWLAHTPSRLAPHARVDAVLALAEARRRLQGDPQGALDVLAAHGATLERVSEARHVAHGAHAELEARRVARARAEVLAAEGDLAGGNASAALARLEAVGLRDLGEDERAAAEALRAEAARIVSHARRVAEVERLRRGGQAVQLFDAMALAGELAVEADGAERARWEEEREAIHAAIQRAFHVEVAREPRPLGEDASPETVGRVFSDASMELTEDGRTMVLCEEHQRWVWLQIVDVETKTVRAEISLRAPEHMGSGLLHVIRGVAYVTGAAGTLLGVDVERFTVELFRTAREMVPSGLGAGMVAIVADSGASRPRYYWSMPADPTRHKCPVQIIDLEQRRVVREITDVVRIGGIPGTREARVGCFRSGGLVLFEDRGAPVSTARIMPRDVVPLGAVVHPSGDGFVVLGNLTGEHRMGATALSVVPPGGSPHAPWLVPDTGGGTHATIASSKETGIIAFLYVSIGRGYELVVVRPPGVGGGSFELLYRISVRSDVELVQDADARRIFAYIPTERAAVLELLGPARPDLPPTQATRPWIGDVCNAPACLGSAGVRAMAYASIREAANRQLWTVTVAQSRGMQQAGDVDALVERARALDIEVPVIRAEAERLRAWLGERHPSLPAVRLLRADTLACDCDWMAVREVLAPCTEASFADEEQAQHLLHLRALSALHLGEADEARRLADAARRFAGACQLAGIDAFLRRRTDPARKGETTLPITQLVWALEDADALLARGDPTGALDALSPRQFAVGFDVQVLARRVEAWLSLSPPVGPGRIAKIMALAQFVDASEADPGNPRTDLPVPGHVWDKARIDALSKRATAWLDDPPAG
jgi:hypothetical protein